MLCCVLMLGAVVYDVPRDGAAGCIQLRAQHEALIASTNHLPFNSEHMLSSKQ